MGIVPDHPTWVIDPAVDGDYEITIHVQAGDPDVDQVVVVEFDACRVFPDVRAYALRAYQLVELHAALGEALAAVRREGRK